MKPCFAITVLCLASATLALAQEPEIEAFLGYTYVRFSSAANVPSFGANGGSGQFDYNFNRWLGGVIDMGAVHNGSIDGAPIDDTFANFLAGPRLSMRFPRLRPYFQILWGGVYGTASTQINAVPVYPSPPIYLPGTPPEAPGKAVTARLVSAQTVFAMTVGGGLDIVINKHMSFRPIALDYYLTRLQNLRTMGDNNQHNLRYTAGLNFTFGAQ